MTKDEEREYWTKLLAENDGAVWCEVWDSVEKIQGLVIAYTGGVRPFATILDARIKENAIEQYKNQDYDIEVWEHATPILTKPLRPWTAEEIMAHGIFVAKDNKRYMYRVTDVSEDKDHTVWYPIDGKLWGSSLGHFCEQFRAVCLELRDGILCDTGKRVELYKDGE